jgi:hypothetical protein
MVETLKKTIKGGHGGARPGSGIKKGTKLARTLEKERTLAEYQRMIREHANQLFQSQKALAFGSVTLFLVEQYEDAGGKIKERKVLVEDKQLMEDILNDPNMVQGDNYTLVVTNSPDKFTIDSMLDRAFGKAAQSISQDIKNESESELAKAILKLAEAKNKQSK